MTKKWLKWLALTSVLVAALSMEGCDWIHFAFMNSIPFKGNPAKNPDIYVYLGVDGLSYHTVQNAINNGTLKDPSWRLAKSISIFPATSDASWTRIMHTPKIGGYEIEYYDPSQNKTLNPGLFGLAKHVAPPMFDFVNFEFDYLKAFDFRANGYTHSFSAYSDTLNNLGETYDAFFYMLNGRIQTSSVFSAYFIEIDVLGHMKSCGAVDAAFKQLAERIEKFKRDHSERNVHFTLLSDHGMDFVHTDSAHFIDMDKALPTVEVTPVESLEGKDASQGTFAVPIKHTLVTYIAMHTLESQREVVAARTSKLESVDLTIAKMKTPPKDPHALSPIEWYGIYSAGALLTYFGFDAQTNEYYLPSGHDYERLDIHGLTFGPTQDFKILKDTEVFALVKNSNYPDIFYRTRSGLSTVSLIYPADVLVSFKSGYASKGFTLLGKDDIASEGFHGAMSELGSAGTLLTNERDLPDTVRSENFLDLFPRMRDHMHSLGVETIQGDRNALLPY